MPNDVVGDIEVYVGGGVELRTGVTRQQESAPPDRSFRRESSASWLTAVRPGALRTALTFHGQGFARDEFFCPPHRSAS